MIEGKYVIQIDSKSPDMTLPEMSWEFAKEKRVFMIGYESNSERIVTMYTTGEVRYWDSFEKFKDFFNEYLFQHMIEKGETTGGRFHRLLTSKELKFLMGKIIEENY